MKNLILGIVSLLLLNACSRVPAGFVGIKVYLLGTSKGVDTEVLNVGRYYIGINEELYLFPTFQQNYVWTKDVTEGSPRDESLTFQTKEGMGVNVDVGISYHLNADKIPSIFQKYRRGIEEITDVFLRNSVRDAINDVGSSMSVEEVYGSKKNHLFELIQEKVIAEVGPQGILIDKLYLVGSMRLPNNVVAALNSKIEATQRAQQRENEVQEAKAQAAKEVATAEGSAKAALMKAKAEAEANQLKLRTLTPELIRYEAIQRWNGVLPQVSGGVVPFLNLDNMKGTK